MDTQKFTSKLQRAYHSMIDMVNVLVDVEYKSVDEAIEIAEEKLSEWEDLSSHEIEKISAEIKQDLKTLVETLSEAKQAYAEQLALDTLYLKERSLDKLAKIADKTTLELAEFKRDLKEQVQVVTDDQYEHNHHQHQQWESEHAMWLDDIAIWQKEHQQIREILYAIHEGIYEHGMTIGKHAEMIRAHQQEEYQHEAFMAATEQGKKTDNQQDAEYQCRHKKMQDTHEEQTRLHQKIKQHHKDIMVLVKKLHQQTILNDE
jgi:hypothetical protein